MWGIETIKALNAEATKKARKAKAKPLAFQDAEDVEQFFKGDGRTFPNLGDLRPSGYEMVEELFCDHSGWGSPGEPALTLEELRRTILEHIDGGNPYAYGVTETGQFQLHLGVFKKTEGGARGKDR